MITSQLPSRLHPAYPVSTREGRCISKRPQLGAQSPHIRSNPPISALCYNPASEETTLANLAGIVKQLSKERDRLHQELSGLNAALEAFAGVYRGTSGIKTRRKISAKGRARIAAAQRARWAKAKGIAEVPKKRRMSALARRKIAAAQRVRWAKVKASEKSRLK
jgi:hypothetical protein